MWYGLRYRFVIREPLAPRVRRRAGITSEDQLDWRILEADPCFRPPWAGPPTVVNCVAPRLFDGCGISFMNVKGVPNCFLVPVHGVFKVKFEGKI